MAQVVFTEQAISDIDDIATYIGYDSLHYAQLQVEKFFKRTEALAQFTQQGRVVPEFNMKSVRELIEGNYRIIYKIVNKNLIHILTVHHSRKMLKRAVIVSASVKRNKSDLS